jgi:hypothetical protein
MPTHQFNARRFKEVRDLLEIEYDKYHDFEKDISLATGNEKILLKQRLKREVNPRLCRLEKEYAELLVGGVPIGQVPEGEAGAIVTELSSVTTEVLQAAPSTAPPEMMRLLEEIKGKLSQTKESASAKLKFSLPLIPTICSYEIQVDTVQPLKAVWIKARDLFVGLLKPPPA